MLSLRRARIGRGLTQEDLAQRAGINPLTVWRIEVGRQRPRPGTALKIATALGVRITDVRELVGGDNGDDVGDTQRPSG